MNETVNMILLIITCGLCLIPMGAFVIAMVRAAGNTGEKMNIKQYSCPVCGLEDALNGIEGCGNSHCPFKGKL